ncbi:MAG: hypothetical protein ABJF11_15315 [Reichenbachiella sp.]|uniref:hypothetical protein n=1 Tax=Reichenbachiella sp. TaxID=2184521 RepID=UPI0032655F80
MNKKEVEQMIDHEIENSMTKLKYLEFVQNIVSRMNQNSFVIKSLTITLVTAYITLKRSDITIEYTVFGALLILIMWGLDSYYLYTERRYRNLFNDIASKRNDTSFSLEVSMEPRLYVKTLFSGTLIIVYMSIIVAFSILKML